MAKIAETAYEVGRAQGVCAASGKAIKVGDEFIAVLAERGEEYVRLDYSRVAWDKGTRPKPPITLIGFWRAKMLPPDDRKARLIDDEALMDLFEDLDQAEDERRLAFRYVLALLLIRKKLLKYEGTRRDGAAGPGRVVMVRRHTPSKAPPAEIVEVLDPSMSDQMVAEAIEQLSAVIAGTGPRA
ncbi:MAG: hypothetical protein ACKVW3_04140 [Phycisphaerales bacterium]